MKKTLMCATAVAAFAGTGFVAQADDGWYGRADVGIITNAGDLDHDAETNVPFTVAGDSKVEDGLLGGLGLGYAFDNGFRLEVAATGRKGDLDPQDGTNAVGTPPVFIPADIVTPTETIIFSQHEDGELSSIDVMVNAIYDFNRDGRLQPYFGAGLGVAQVDARVRNIAATYVGPSGPGNSIGANGFNDKETALAIQGMAGFGYGLTEKLTFDLGLRAMSVQDLTFDGTDETGSLVSYDADYTDLSATIGLRSAFGATPPPPPTPPTPPHPPPPPPPRHHLLHRLQHRLKWLRLRLAQR